jgi:hypothetical protein
MTKLSPLFFLFILNIYYGQNIHKTTKVVSTVGDIYLETATIKDGKLLVIVGNRKVKEQNRLTSFLLYDTELNKLKEINTKNAGVFSEKSYDPTFFYKFKNFVVNEGKVTKFSNPQNHISLGMSITERTELATECDSSLFVITVDYSKATKTTNYFKIYSVHLKSDIVNVTEISTPRNINKVNWKILSLGKYFYQFHETYTDKGKGNKENPHKLKIYLNQILYNGKTKNMELISSQETYHKYKNIMRGRSLFSNTSRNEFYLAYPNKEFTSMIFDVFDKEGNLKYTLKKDFEPPMKYALQEQYQNFEEIGEDKIGYKIKLYGDIRYFFINLKNKTIETEKRETKLIDPDTPIHVFYIRHFYKELYQQIEKLVFNRKTSFDGAFSEKIVLVEGEKYKYCITDNKKEITIYKFE